MYVLYILPAGIFLIICIISKLVPHKSTCRRQCMPFICWFNIDIEINAVKLFYCWKYELNAYL